MEKKNEEKRGAGQSGGKTLAPKRRSNEEGRLRQEEVMRTYAGAGPRINTRSIPSPIPGLPTGYFSNTRPLNRDTFGTTKASA